MPTLIDEIEESKEVNREYIVKTRIGQAKFRDRIIEESSEYKICSMSKIDLFVASHIKP